jgi:DNA-binding response OmpR family regulator
MNHSKPFKILIADENTSVRNALRLTFAQQGNPVFEAQNALEALEIFNTKVPEMVFIDSMIEGEISGVTLCQLIKSMTLPYYCFVVLLYSKASEKELDACFSAGADNYLIKPFKPTDVLKFVDERNNKSQLSESKPSTSKNMAHALDENREQLQITYESLSGFDPAALDNLEFMLGSKNKVFDSLRCFVVDFSDSVDEIRELFSTQQKELTRRRLHSLKGTAAIVGANNLSALAAEIEALVFKSDNIDEKLVNLNDAWQIVNHTVLTTLSLDN